MARLFFDDPPHLQEDVIEASSSLRFRLRQRHLHHRSPSVVVVLVQFVLYLLSPPLLRKSLRFISRAMAASVHPMMMVCTPTFLATLCRGGFSQPHSIQSQGEEYSPTPPFCHARREGRMDPRVRQLRLGRCWFVEVGRNEDGRTDRVIVSSLDMCLASAAGKTKAAARRPFSILAFVAFFISAPRGIFHSE